MTETSTPNTSKATRQSVTLGWVWSDFGRVLAVLQCVEANELEQFRLSRNRDAWFVIRGYKYQIDLTILRWLTLSDDQSLLLEFGEDIEIVTSALKQMANRELEQVKHLDTPITLNSPPCKIAIANAASHFRANPHLRLLFRFCTNASVTTERPSPFEDRKPGIEVWEKLRKSPLSHSKHANRLNKLLGFLRRPDIPNGCDANTWELYLAEANGWTAETLFEFINCFEWSTQLPSADDLAPKIKDLLITIGIPSKNVELVYPRLFLYVIVLMSKPGEKQLSKGQISQLTELPDLDGPNQEVLTFLNDEVLSHQSRIEQLESVSSRHRTAIASLKREMLELRFGGQVSVNLTTAIGEIETELPPVVDAHCERREVVSKVKETTVNRDWLSIYGSLGSGKTQLAALLGRHSDSVIYVSLRDLNSAEAGFLLHHLFLQLCVGKPTSSITVSGLESLEIGTNIFLDDVPRLINGDRLSKRLIAIARAVSARNQTLITLSHHPVPRGVRNALGEIRFVEIQVPPLTPEEAIDLFKEHGAPADSISIETATSFVQSTKGNPTLLAAHALSLRESRWETVDAYRATTAEHVLDGELTDQTMQRLLETVSDTKTRDLLYRHCVILGQFSQEESSVVAQVEPAIARQNERLSALQGLWLEKQTSGISLVCPLIIDLGMGQLQLETKRRVAAALANFTLGKRMLDPIKFAKAIHYLRLAEHPVRLCMCILGALESVESLPINWQKLVADVTNVDDILDGCPTSLAILVKAKQIRLANSIGAPIQGLVDEGQQLLAHAEKSDQWAVLSYAMHVAPQVAEVDFEAGLNLCEFILRNIEGILEDMNYELRLSGELLDSPLSEAAVVYPWFLVPTIDSESKFDQWFGMLTIQDEAIHAIFEAEIAPEGFRICLDRLWQRQLLLPEANRCFDEANAIYDRVIAFAQQKELDLIEALAVRAKIIVLAEYQSDLDAAVELALTYLESDTNPEVRFLINDILGRQYKYAKQNAKALPFLEQAAGFDTRSFDGIRCRTFLELAKVIGDSDSKRSLALCEQSIDIADRNPAQVSELDLIVALGEAANAAWLDGEREKAYDYMDRAFISLNRTKEDSVEWKMRAAMIGNALGYMSSMVTRGEPPLPGYVRPQRGHLLGYNQEVANWYDKKTRAEFDTAIILLVAYASAIDNTDRAAYWASKSLDQARREGVLVAVYKFAEALIPSYLKEKKYLEAIDLGVEAAIALGASVVARRKGESAAWQTCNAPEMLGQKPSNDWKESEEYGVQLAVIPAIVSICVSASSTEPGFTLIKDYCNNTASTASSPDLFESIAYGLTIATEDWKAVPIHDLGLQESRKGNFSSAASLYALSSFAPDASLEEGVLQHLFILHGFAVRSSDHSGLLNYLYKLIIEHWEGAFVNQRFMFRAPSDVEKQLLQARTLQTRDRMRAIVRTMVSGLRVNIPDSLQASFEWLS